MAILTENKIEINRSINEVYDFVINMENFGKWFPEVIKIESQNNLEHGVVGKKYIETVKDPFKGEVQIVIEVKKAEQNTSFITEGEYAPLLPKMILHFSETVHGGTAFTWAMESRTKNTFVKILLIPVAKLVMKKRAKIGVMNLKKILEKTRK
ncbi:MAG: polyketide cyclase [Desulfobacterium sp.]|nr:polyketide cyclase [Desulfobacterium sp.]